MLSRSRAHPEPSDLATCRTALCAGSKSFAAASRILPAEVRDAATILYAFCRDADDAVDLHIGGTAAVAHLRERLDAIYSGTPHAYAADRALTDVVYHHALPRELLDALIEGFEWDAHGRRYATLDELEAYAARVAGTIGAMMAVLMGARSSSALARACDLGVAMQLTNIARDVGEDARAGRIYLPLDALRRAGVDPDLWLAAPLCSDGVRAVVAELLARADVLYARVHSGVAQLAPGCRPGINAARFIYADIGRVVRTAGNDSVSRRAVVSGSRKVWLLAKSYLIDVEPAQGGDAPPLDATRYLVEAVLACSTQPVARSSSLHALPWWYFKSRALWLLDLFERLERRERTQVRAPYAQGLADPGSLQ